GDQILGGELAVDLIEQGGDVGARLAALDQRHDVVGVLQVLIILELDILPGRIRAVAREDQANVDIAAVEGGFREWPAGIERLEGFEMQTVFRRQARLAKRSGGALRRYAMRQLAGDQSRGRAGGPNCYSA